MNIKKITTISILLLTFTLFIGCSKKSNDKLIIGTSADFPPYEYLENDSFKGIEIDILYKIGEILNKKIEIKNMDFDGVLTSLASGKVDLGVAAISINEERLKQFDFTDKIFSNDVKIVQKDNDNYQTDKDLKNINIGFQIGTTAQDYINTALKDNNVKPVGYKDYIQALTDLKNNKIDCIIMDQIPASKIIESKKGFKLSNSPLYSDEGAFAVKKNKNSELIKDINKALQKLKDSGQYQEILNKYYK